MKKMKRIELIKAEQQFLGFAHAKDGYSARDLAESMGLKKDEWEALKPMLNLKDSDIEDIDNFLNQTS